MSVYALNKRNDKKKVAVLPVKSQTVIGAALKYQDNARFNQFWDMLEAVQIHGYIRAAMSVIGRSTVGAWWTLVQSDFPAKKAPSASVNGSSSSTPRPIATGITSRTSSPLRRN